MVRLLARIVGVGVETADMLVHEVLSRPMRDRRAVARYAGLTGAPDESGAQRREQGLARAGNARVLRGMIQLAWRFLLFQKESALALWYRARTADSRIGTRKTMIVALARKLVIALWRFAALGGSPGERAKLVRELVEKIIVDERTIVIKLRRGLLLGGDVPSSASEAASEGAVELTAAAAFTRRGAETKLALPGLAQQNHSSRCDPALIKAIARARAWFEELATGRARSLQELAKRDGITRRYIRRLVGLAFLSPQLVEAILQGRQPVELTATRLTELDLPLDWTEQHKLLGS